MTYHGILLKVLIQLFQKLVRVWGETPRSFTSINFYLFVPLFDCWVSLQQSGVPSPKSSLLSFASALGKEFTDDFNLFSIDIIITPFNIYLKSYCFYMNYRLILNLFLYVLKFKYYIMLVQNEKDVICIL